MAKRNYRAGADRGNKLSTEHPRGLRGSTFGPAGPAQHIDPATMQQAPAPYPARAIAKVRRMQRRTRDDRSNRDRHCMVCGLALEVVTITDGANPDGTLRVLTFCSHAHAAEAWDTALGQWRSATQS